MATKQDILDTRRARSSEVTKQVRLMAFGIIALVYTTLTSSSEFATKMALEYETEYLIILVSSAISIAADYVQSAVGYYVAKNVNLNEPDENGSFEYDDKSLSYKSTIWCYYAKQAALAVAILLLIYIISRALI